MFFSVERWFLCELCDIVMEYIVRPEDVYICRPSMMCLSKKNFFVCVDYTCMITRRANDSQLKVRFVDF